MTKRTISWLLCLMMVVSLFAGTLTSASAANVGVTVSPAAAEINGTGSAEFTVGTVLDSLTDQIASGKEIDLGSWVGSLKEQGFNVDELAGLLEGAGFNWDDIIGSLSEGGFSMDEIAGALTNAIGSGEFNLEDILGDLTGDEGTLKDLVDALKEQGFSSDIFDELWKAIDGNEEGGGLGGLVGDLIGRFGKNSDENAAALDEGSEPEAGEDDSVTTVIASKLKEALKEKYGDLFTAEKEAEFDELFGNIEGASDALSLSDAVKGIADIMGSEDFDLNKTVEAIMDATNGTADYSELIKALQDSTGSDLNMDQLASAFNEALGSDLDVNKLAEALQENLGTDFDTKDFLEALGTDVDMSKLAEAVAKNLGMEEGAIDADAVTKALNEALKEDGGFDLEAFAAAMGEDFDASAFVQSVADSLSGTEGAIDAKAVSDAIESALSDQGEQTSLDNLAAALKAAMGDNLDVEALTEALTTALTSEDGETPALENVISAVTGVLGDDMTADQLTDMVKGLTDSLGEDMTVQDLVDALSNQLPEQFGTGDLLDALQNALGEDFDLEAIAKQLLGEDTDINDLINALKERDFSPADITDLLFGADVSYQWYVKSEGGAKQVALAKDQNTYSGDTTRTLTVTRDTAPKADETYTYYCMVKVTDKEYTSGDAVLTIKASGASEDPGTEPTTEPTSPVPTLDNVQHTAYISGYPDGTVLPNNQISRAEVATILFRLMTEESRNAFKTTANTFSDVKAGDWFNEAVSTLARASVLLGYPDGTFAPNAKITRAEMATILTRLAVLDTSGEKTGDAKNFPDVTGHWAAGNIRTASAKGWINGYEDGSFRPDNKITRAEAVTMVNRMLNRNPEKLTNTDGMNTFTDNMNTSAWYYIQIQEAANGHTFTRNDKGVESWTAVVK